MVWKISERKTGRFVFMVLFFIPALFYIIYLFKLFLFNAGKSPTKTEWHQLPISSQKLFLCDRLSHHRSSVFQSVCLKLSNISWKWRSGVGWNLFVSLKWRTAMSKLKHWVNYSHYIGASNEKNNPITEFLIKQSTTPSKTGRKCDFNSKKNKGVLPATRLR